MRSIVTVLLLAAGLPLAWSAETDTRAVLTRVGHIAATLGPDRPLRYDVAVKKGEYLQLEAMQKGVDLVLRVVDPAGTVVGEIDSPNGLAGPEPLGFEAMTDGVYQVEVACLDPKAPAGAFELRVAYALDAATYARYRIVDVGVPEFVSITGTYELAPDHRVIVSFLGGVNVGREKPVAVLLDMKTREMATLHAASKTRFFLGPGLLDPYPAVADYEFTLGPDGSAASLRVTPAGGKAMSGPRVAPLRMERVTFRNDDVTLEGWLTLPAGPGPFPAVVLAHGSQAFTGEPFYMGPFLAQKGVAFLSFDKRGSGRSTGDWKSASLPTLAGDVLAGAAYLRGRKEIVPTRVGVWGVSQGGWVGAIAAAQSKEVAFLVAQVGSGVSVAENMVHETRSVMRNSGMAEAEQEEATALLRKAYLMMSDGRGPDEVRAAVGPALKPAWTPYFSLLAPPPANYFWEWMRLNGHVDSIPYVEKLTQPVLWMLAGEDTQVPLALSEPRLRAAFTKSGNAGATLKVLARSSHGLFEVERDASGAMLPPRRMIAGYWDLLGGWIDANVLAPR